MNGKQLTKKEHIARYCNPRSVSGDKILPIAFTLRPKKNGKPAEKNLSVFWIEFFSGSIQSQIKKTINAIGKFLNLKGGKVARLNIGKTIDYVKKESSDKRLLSIWLDSNPSSPSHTSIKGLRQEDNEIATLISETIIDTFEP